MQPRATINLSKATKLIDDRSALTQRETTGKGGSRRRSGFAEEEEGYMFVEEGFRIRFGNGEGKLFSIIKQSLSSSNESLRVGSNNREIFFFLDRLKTTHYYSNLHFILFKPPPAN